MKLLEILNTKPDITWTNVKNQWFGKFKLKNSIFTIHLDEYTYENFNVLDFGFDTDGDINAKLSNKPSAKIIGAVLNGASPKINALKPDIILISILKTSGLVSSRKSLYDVLISWFQKRSNFTYVSDWIENNKAFYKIIAKKKPSIVDLEVFVKSASTNKE